MYSKLYFTVYCTRHLQELPWIRESTPPPVSPFAGEVRGHEKERQKKNNHNMSEWVWHGHVMVT